MGRASPALGAFNAGEWSPQMEGRVDVDKYGNAAHICFNNIPLVQGPARRRPGTCYAQTVKSPSRSWLQRFEFSATQAYLIEFGDLYCRFYTNHGPLLCNNPPAWLIGTAYTVGQPVLSGGICYYCMVANTGLTPASNPTYWYPMTPYQGSSTVGIYEIPSPYAGADLTDSQGEFTLQVAQSGDVLYIAGGYAGAGYLPYKLTRYANNPPQWTFALYSPIDGPYSSAAPIIPNANIALGVSATNGIGITITAYGGNVFAATDVGRLVRIASQTYNVTPWENNHANVLGDRVSNNGNNYICTVAGTTGGAPPVHTKGAVYDGTGGAQWTYTDSGYGVAQITAYTSPTSVTAKVLTQFPANLVPTSGAITGITRANPAVVSGPTVAVGDPVFISGVVGMTQINGNMYTASAASAGSTTLSGINSSNYTAWSSGGTMVKNCSLGWQLGAWSATTEYPRAVAFYKDRLFWGTKLGLFGSVPGQYDSHTPDFFGLVTTDAATNTLVTGADASNITWLTPAIILLVGTEGGEYGVDATSPSTPLGPDNIECLPQSRWRSRHIAPQMVGTSVIYVQRSGRKLKAMDYNFYLNRYDSTDQSKFAYHITIGGVIAMAYQQEPYSCVWCVRADGELLSYTYNREENVTAWARHKLGGGGIVESVAVIPAPDGLRDELWMIVRRTVNGATVRMVEYMAKDYEGPTADYAGDAQSSAWYLDCAAQSNQTPAPGATTTTVSGLGYLQGLTVGCLADGGVQAPQVVPASGILTYPGAFSVLTIGLPYSSQLVPMRMEGGADVGTAQGKLKDGVKLVLRLVDSAGGVCGQLASMYQQLDAIQYNDPVTPLGSPPPIQSGDFPIDFNQTDASDQDARDFYIMVQQDDPLPMTIVGIFPSYEVSEPR